MNATRTRTSTSNTMTTRRFPNANTARAIVNAYKGGTSIDGLVERFGGSVSSIRNLLVVNGVEIKGRGRYPASN